MAKIIKLKLLHYTNQLVLVERRCHSDGQLLITLAQTLTPTHNYQYHHTGCPKNIVLLKPKNPNQK